MAFFATLERGFRLFDEGLLLLLLKMLDHLPGPNARHTSHIAGLKAKRGNNQGGALPTITAEVAFQLYDTFGFPLDLTEMICRERGWLVDVTGAEKLMNEKRRRGKVLAGKSALNDGIEGDSSFTGFYYYFLC